MGLYFRAFGPKAKEGANEKHQLPLGKPVLKSGALKKETSKQGFEGQMS